LEGPFRRSPPPDLRLIETLGWRPGEGYRHLEAHLARLERTARAFGAPFERPAIERALGATSGDGPQRVRLTIGLQGRIAATAHPLEPDPALWTVRLAELRLDPADPWLRVKTTERSRYDAARAALSPGVDEVIFLNTRGEICEGAITNVFLEIDGALVTPPLSCGLLPGILRESLLRSGRAREAVLRLEDLGRGGLFVGNALRGLRPARLDRPPRRARGARAG
jgi:4-amino-4-deoxychorismate lyase